MSHFVVVWGRDAESSPIRPYNTYMSKESKPVAFAPGNLWFADCPTATSLEDLDEILSHDQHQQVVILLDDARELFGWEEFETPEES